MLADLVQETTNAPGTAVQIVLAGAPQGRNTFAQAFANNAQCFYYLTDGVQTEVGIGTMLIGTPNKLARTTVLGNSLGTTARLNFTGAVIVYNSLPAQRTPILGSDGKLPGASIPSRSEVKSGSWTGGYDLSTVDTDFISISIPNGTKTIHGSMSVRGENQDPVVAQAIFEAIVQNGSGAEVGRNTCCNIAAGANVPRYWSTGGGFVFQSAAAAGFTASAIVLKARKSGPYGPFLINNYWANAIFHYA